MRFLLFLITLSSLIGAQSVRADNTCRAAQECQAQNAACRDGICTFPLPVRLLFDGVPGIQQIRLITPVPLANETPEPVLQWEWPTGADLLALAIFKTFPERYGTPPRIMNHQDIVWFWHSGLNQDRPALGATRATFAEGRTLQSSMQGSAQVFVTSTSRPPALAAGVYHVAAWAWTGVSLTHHSEIRSFVVGRDNITGGVCPVDSAFSTAWISLPGKKNDRNENCVRRYCVLKCASDADCFHGYTCDLSHIQRAGISPMDMSAPVDLAAGFDGMLAPGDLAASPDLRSGPTGNSSLAPPSFGICRQMVPSCDCPHGGVCDETLKICYSGAELCDVPIGAGPPGSCGCRISGAGRPLDGSGKSVLLAAALLLGLVRVRRGRRKPRAR